MSPHVSRGRTCPMSTALSNFWQTFSGTLNFPPKTGNSAARAGYRTSAKKVLDSLFFCYELLFEREHRYHW